MVLALPSTELWNLCRCNSSRVSLQYSSYSDWYRQMGSWKSSNKTIWLNAKANAFWNHHCRLGDHVTLFLLELERSCCTGCTPLCWRETHQARGLGLPGEGRNHPLSSAREVFLPLAGGRFSVRQTMVCPVPDNAPLWFNDCILLAGISHSCCCKKCLSQTGCLTWRFVMLLSLNKHTSLGSELQYFPELCPSAIWLDFSCLYVLLYLYLIWFTSPQCICVCSELQCSKIWTSRNQW